jgi:phenylpyruvate tautomerase
MPLLQIHSSVQTIEKLTLEEIHREGAKILSHELGKSIEYVMVVVNAGSSISFAQDSSKPSAYLEVKNIGELSPAVTAKLSMQLCELTSQKLGVEKNRIYIEYQEAQRHQWGWNGKTFA